MDRLVPLKDVLARCGISRSFLYSELARGRIEAIKIGKRTAFREAELTRYLSELPSARIGQAAKTAEVTPIAAATRRRKSKD